MSVRWVYGAVEEVLGVQWVGVVWSLSNLAVVYFYFISRLLKLEYYLCSFASMTSTQIEMNISDWLNQSSPRPTLCIECRITAPLSRRTTTTQNGGLTCLGSSAIFVKFDSLSFYFPVFNCNLRLLTFFHICLLTKSLSKSKFWAKSLTRSCMFQQPRDWVFCPHLWSVTCPKKIFVCLE